MGDIAAWSCWGLRGLTYDWNQEEVHQGINMCFDSAFPTAVTLIIRYGAEIWRRDVELGESLLHEVMMYRIEWNHDNIVFAVSGLPIFTVTMSVIIS